MAGEEDFEFNDMMFGDDDVKKSPLNQANHTDDLNKRIPVTVPLIPFPGSTSTAHDNAISSCSVPILNEPSRTRALSATIRLGMSPRGLQAPVGEELNKEFHSATSMENSNSFLSEVAKQSLQKSCGPVTPKFTPPPGLKKIPKKKKEAAANSFSISISSRNGEGRAQSSPVIPGKGVFLNQSNLLKNDLLLSNDDGSLKMTPMDSFKVSLSKSLSPPSQSSISEMDVDNVSLNGLPTSTVEGNDDEVDEEKEEMMKVAPSTDDFQLLCVIGMGAFGRVLQVRNRLDKKMYAMKVISKKLLKRKNSVENMIAEKEILTKVEHPFVVKLMCSFATEKKLFLVMEFMHGGELFFHLRKAGLLLDTTARFYVGEILLALEFLHSKNIIHRDLKPENVLMSIDGHAVLTDFGLAKDFRGSSSKCITSPNPTTNATDSNPSEECSLQSNEGKEELPATSAFSERSASFDDEGERTRTLCGTTEYMAPEMLRRTGYNKAVDFWSLGALMYEMMIGRPPFTGKTTKDIEEKILTAKPKFPPFLRSESTAMMKSLLEKNVSKRMGATKSTMFEVGGVAFMKRHKFFQGLDWKKLLAKQITPPIEISVLNDDDMSNFDTEFTGMEVPGSISEPSSPSHSVGSPDWRNFGWCADHFKFGPENEMVLDEQVGSEEEGLLLPPSMMRDCELNQAKGTEENEVKQELNLKRNQEVAVIGGSSGRKASKTLDGLLENFDAIDEKDDTAAITTTAATTAAVTISVNKTDQNIDKNSKGGNNMNGSTTTTPSTVVGAGGTQVKSKQQRSDKMTSFNDKPPLPPKNQIRHNAKSMGKEVMVDISEASPGKNAKKQSAQQQPRQRNASNKSTSSVDSNNSNHSSSSNGQDQPSTNKGNASRKSSNGSHREKQGAPTSFLVQPEGGNHSKKSNSRRGRSDSNGSAASSTSSQGSVNKREEIRDAILKGQISASTVTNSAKLATAPGNTKGNGKGMKEAPLSVENGKGNGKGNASKGKGKGKGEKETFDGLGKGKGKGRATAALDQDHGLRVSPAKTTSKSVPNGITAGFTQMTSVHDPVAAEKGKGGKGKGGQVWPTLKPSPKSALATVVSPSKLPNNNWFKNSILDQQKAKDIAKKVVSSSQHTPPPSSSSSLSNSKVSLPQPPNIVTTTPLVITSTNPVPMSGNVPSVGGEKAGVNGQSGIAKDDFPPLFGDPKSNTNNTGSAWGGKIKEVNNNSTSNQFQIQSKTSPSAWGKSNQQHSVSPVHNSPHVHGSIDNKKSLSPAAREWKPPS